MEELEINKLKLLLLAFLIITISSCIGSAAEIHVSPGNSIQTAVNGASSGDTIIVEPGTYVGNIDISKMGSLDNLVLRSSSGNPADTIIIADNSAPTTVKGVISITKFKTNVTVNGFTISQAREGMAGVYIENSNHCTIENNIFMNDGLGVSVSGGTGSNIIRNNIVNRTSAASPDSTYTGINIDNSANTVVSQNTVTNNKNGIHFSRSTKGSSVSGNTINNNVQYGIYLENVKGVTVDGNTLNLNGLIGIDLAGSSENYVTNNDVTMVGVTYPQNDPRGTNTQGIQLIFTGTEASPVGSDSNIIANNKVEKSDHGIFVNRCKNNTIQNNRALDNNYGIAMRFASNNRVINNNADGNTNGNNREGIFLTFDDTNNIVSGNSASGCDRGIELSADCGTNNIVDNNTVNLNQYYGIYVLANGNTISNNSLTQNARGIFLTGPTCRNNLVSNNLVTQSSGNGINLLNTSYGNRIIGNRLISNTNGKGIEVFNSNNSYLDSNFAQDNDIGVQLEYSNLAMITNNEATQNRIGFRLFNSSNNSVTGNKATSGSGTDSGIDLNSATNNSISGNFVTLNEKGISMCPACRDNLVYNNYFSNSLNTYIQNSHNTWYKDRTAGKNIMKGPYIGGNFWGSPDGSGFSQTAHDSNGDGISDTQYTYTSPAGITISDLYPLVSVILPVADFSFTPAQGTAPLTVRFADNSQNADSRIWNFGEGNTSNEQNPEHTYSKAGTYTTTLTVSNKNDTVSKSATITVQEYVAPPVIPVADFSANPSSGDSPLNVQFTDNSQNAAAWSWDFGDGATSNEKNPSHTFYGDTTYTVTLTASNANGQASKQTGISVSSGGSGGGSGGGGGAGGSPEPQNNVEIKELSQTFIASGQSAKFDFPQQATAVVSIGFDSKKTAGKTTTIVEMLKAKSTLVSGVPADEVYKFLNIWVGNSGFATPTNIENAVVNFKVAKSWVKEKNIDKSSITLNRYSDKTWNTLPTSLSGEDDNYLYLTAKTPGFSPFAVNGKSAASIQPAVDKTAVNAAQDSKANGSTAANTQKTPAQKENTTSSSKQSTSLPGFEAVFGVVGLLAVFIYKRK